MGKHRHRRKSSSNDRLKDRIRALERELLNRGSRSASRQPPSTSGARGDRQRSPSSNRSRSRSRSRSHSINNALTRNSPDQVENDRGNFVENSSEPDAADIQLGGELDNSTGPDASELNYEVLNLLGDIRKSDESRSGSIHKDIAVRWQAILQGGLEPETRTSILSKYPAIGNCPLATAPKLNLEVKASVAEPIIKRDSRLAVLQSQIGAALSALGKGLTILLDEREERESRLEVIELVSDAGRLLSDLHHEKSKSRRLLISSELNKTFKETLTDASLDGWLFGDNLGERMKVAKALERSSLELRTPGAKKHARGSLSNSTVPKGHLNSRGPTRPYFRSPRQFGQRTNAQHRTFSRGNNRSNYRQPPQTSAAYRKQPVPYKGQQ